MIRAGLGLLIALSAFLLGLGGAPTQCCESGGYHEVNVLGSGGNDYLGLGWGPKEASRFLTLYPDAYLFLSGGLTNRPVNQSSTARTNETNAITEIHGSSLPNLGTDARICSSMGPAKFRVNNGDTVPETLDDTVTYGPLAGEPASAFVWSEDMLLKVPAEDWSTHMARFPGVSTCGASVDQDWLDEQLYTDPASNNWCGDGGDADTDPDNDPPTRNMVPIPTGGPDKTTEDNLGGYRIKAFWFDLRDQTTRDYAVQRVMEQMEDIGVPRCLQAITGKVGNWRVLPNADQFGEDEGRDAECSYPSESGVWIGPAIPPSAEVCPGSPDRFDPSCNCDSGVAAPLVPSPYNAGEFRSAWRDVVKTLLDEINASSVHSGMELIVQERPESLQKWNLISDILAASPTTILGEVTFPWTPGPDPLSPNVSLTASLAVEPSGTLSRTIDEGGTTSDHTRDVSNDGDGGSSLDWSASVQSAQDCGGTTGTGWATQTGSGTGLQPSDASQTSTEGYANEDGCAAGTYTATIRYTSAEADDSPIDRTLELVVESASASLTAGFSITKATSCYSPCGVMVDAVEDRASPQTTSDDTVNEFHDVHFAWDFISGSGDATADLNDGAYAYGEGGSDSKTTQYGPMAAHVYEITDGGGNYTFTIQLTATIGGVTDTVTQTVQVLDPSGLPTTCVTQAASDPGCPDPDTVLTSQSASDFKSIIEARRGQRILFEGSQTWTATSSIDPGTGTIVGAYNANNRPTLHQKGSGEDGFASSSSDWTVYDFIMRGPASGSYPRAFHDKSAEPSAKNILIFRTKTVENTWHQAVARSSLAVQPYGSMLISENNFYRTGSGAWGGSGNGGNIIAGKYSDSAIVGNRVGDPSEGEHTIRIFQCPESCLIADNDLGPERDKKANLTIRGEDGGSPPTTLVEVSRNYLLCRYTGCNNSVADNDGGNSLEPVGRDVLWASNYCVVDPAPDGDSRSCMGSSNSERVTFRNNACHFTDGHGRCIQVSGADHWCYNNSKYQAESSPYTTAVVEGECRSGNNLLYAPNDDSGAKVLQDAVNVGGNVRVSANPWVISNPDNIDGIEDFKVSSPNALIIDQGYGTFSTDPALPQTDAFGTARPQGGGVDIGVHEQ